MTISTTREPIAIEAQFLKLAAEWEAATALLSSTSAMISHPAYQAIIALGPPVVPLLLAELERQPAHWFEALRSITGEDPVPREDWGNIPAMTARWLALARSRGPVP